MSIAPSKEKFVNRVFTSNETKLYLSETDFNLIISVDYLLHETVKPDRLSGDTILAK